MSCGQSSLTSVDDDPVSDYPSKRSRSVATSYNGESPERRRRKSSVSQRIRHEIKENKETVYLKVNQFLADLGNRLESVQEYGRAGRHELNVSIDRAYTTLQTVRERCSSLGDFTDVRLRAMVLVETVEATCPSYRDKLPTFDSLEARATACVQILESVLADLESRGLALRDSSVRVLDEKLRRAEDGIKSARELVDNKLEKAKESIRHSISYACSKAREQGLITYDDLPVPWRINPHIIRGYRFCESSVDCIGSIFRFTNESVNIWSHLLGVLFVLILAFYYFPNSLNYILATPLDLFFVGLFFIAACKCLVCSCLWHTMNSIADRTLMERFACVDYTGISLLIAASIMTTEHAAFYCEPFSRWLYISATLCFGVVGTIVPWHPFFNREDVAWARVAFYISLGATGLVPVIQLVLTRGVSWAYYFYAPITMSVLVYIVGAVVYATRIPEKFLPGWFDYFGGSHNLWHFAVLSGIAFHYVAMSEMFGGAYERASKECPGLFLKEAYQPFGMDLAVLEWA